MPLSGRTTEAAERQPSNLVLHEATRSKQVIIGTVAPVLQNWGLAPYYTIPTPSFLSTSRRGHQSRVSDDSRRLRVTGDGGQGDDGRNPNAGLLFGRSDVDRTRSFHSGVEEAILPRGEGVTLHDCRNPSTTPAKDAIVPSHAHVPVGVMKRWLDAPLRWTA